MSIFRFEHVTKRYRDGHRECVVLEDVSFEIDAGDFVGIWGARRSGKSTLLRVAAGFELPDEGRIFFDGQDLTRLSADERAEMMRIGGIGYVASNMRPIMSRDALEHVALPLLACKVDYQRARRIAHEHLVRMGVGECAHIVTDNLSVGEAIRVGLAHALAREPRLLFVDEPAALPSPIERQELYSTLRSLGKSSSLALVIASEDLDAIGSSRRTMTVGAGGVRSMDKAGELVEFPIERASEGRSR